MPKIRETLWMPEEHTYAKIRILRYYLEAWIPILSAYHDRGLIIDGFAGPGLYADGKDGSPVVALDVWQQRQNQDKGRNMEFLFIESRADRADHLREHLEKRFPQLPNYQVVQDLFLTQMITYLDQLDATPDRHVPTFTFIDPFGYSHSPMSVIRRLMSREKTEVFITFMIENLNRNIENEYQNQEIHYTELLGTDEWQQMLTGRETVRERLLKLHDLYIRQLKNVAGIRYTHTFVMYSERRTPVYHLIFGTNSLEGLRKMKEAMSKVDPSLSYSFSDVIDQNQLRLDITEIPPVQEYLMREFGGKPAVTIAEIDEFVLDKTPYFTFAQELGALEREKKIKVKRPIGMKKGFLSQEGVIVQFILQEPVKQSTLFGE